MIGRLTGLLASCQAPELQVDVNGVGYDLVAPMTTIYQLPNVGEKVVLHTHFSVSENAQQLFGFFELRDRSFFRILIKVSGVGPKMAVGIMSMDTDDIVRCILEEDISALVKIPGVGKKTAERLLVEVRDKLQGWQPENDNTSAKKSLESQVSSDEKITQDAESALVNLGYKPAEASKAVTRAYSDDITRSEDLIRKALKMLLPTK